MKKETKKYEYMAPSTSLHKKSVPTGDPGNGAGPQSFNKKKDGSTGGDFRPKGYTPAEQWGGM